MAYISKRFPSDINKLIINSYLNVVDRSMLFCACEKNDVILSSMDVVVATATEKGYTNILIWIEKLVDIKFYSDSIITNASRYGHLDIIKRYEEYITPGTIISPACFGGQLHVLKWLDETNYYKSWKYQDSACTAAAGEGHLEVVKWLVEKLCPISRNAFIGALLGEHIHVLDWLYFINHDYFGGREATKQRKLKSLKWLHSRRLFDVDECMKIAKRENYPEIVDWIISEYPNRNFE